MTDMDITSGAGGPTGTGAGFASRPDAPAESSAAQGSREQAQEAAGTAADEGKRVAGVAGEEAQRLVDESKQHARALMEDARGELEDQSRTQRDRLVQTLGTLGNDLDRMAGQADSGLASELVRNAAQRVQAVSGRLEGREPTELLDDVRDFARRRPGVFLLGALAAGVVAGRVARGAQRAQSSSSPSTTPDRRSGLPQQRTTEYGTTGTTATTSLPETPEAPAMATVPPDQPGRLS